MSSHPMPRYVPLSILVIGSLLLAIPFHLRPENFIVDDGFFYPQIARFIVHGQGSTFNGIVPTNGYHPLWMLVCVVAAWLTPSSGALIQILTTVQDLLLAGSVALIALIARTSRLRGAALAIVPLLFFGTVLGMWRLLEANLSLALQLTTLVVVVPVFPDLQRRLGAWRAPLLGVLLGLVMLARLDLVFFAITVLLYELLRKEDESSTLVSRLLACFVQGVVMSLVLAPYLLWNWTHFHHLLPISGAIKSSFPHVQHWSLAPFMYPVALAILLNASLLLRRERTSFHRLCLLSAAAAALHMMYTISFGQMAPWYLTTGYLTVAFCVIWITDAILTRAPALAWAEPTLAGIIFLAFLCLASLRLVSNFTYTHLRTGQLSFNGSYREAKRALGEKLDQALPPGSRIMIFDAPGGVAFYSHQAILPVDGLISDYAYNREVVQDTLTGYLAKEHIDYFLAPYLNPGQTYDRLHMVGTSIPHGQVMTVEAPLTHQAAGSITLTDANLVLRFREINPDLETIYPEIGVWRIPHPADGH
jgi:hypothetical protein